VVITLSWSDERQASSNTDWILLHFLKRVEVRRVDRSTVFSRLDPVDYNRIKKLASQCGATVVDDPPMTQERWEQINRKFGEFNGDRTKMREWMAKELSKAEIFDYFINALDQLQP